MVVEPVSVFFFFFNFIKPVSVFQTVEAREKIY